MQLYDRDRSLPRPNHRLEPSQRSVEDAPF
jgi:hypothetical protein